jgi:hypothetical protein
MLLGRDKNFKFKILRVETMSCCFKSPLPKFQPKIQSIMAHWANKIHHLCGKSKGC